MKRTVIIAIVVAAFACGSWFGYRRLVAGGPAKRTKIETRMLTNKVIVSMLEETGTVRPMNSVIIKSEVNGRVDAVFVEDGDVVTAGCVLVELD